MNTFLVFIMMESLFCIILLGFCHGVQVQALHQAKLTADSSAITETDSVTFSCTAPAHVSVHECYFYVNGGTLRSYSCINTFTGTELLWMAKQRSSSVVEVRCFYTVIYGAVNSPSPHSDISYITVGLKPQMSVNYLKGQFAMLSCSLPGSVKPDTKCNFYFGESSHAAATATIQKSSKTNQGFCLIEITEGELLRNLRLVEQKEISCDYSLENGGKSFSPRSDPYILPGIINEEITKISTKPTRFTKTPGSLDAVLTIQESITPRTSGAFTTGTTKQTRSMINISTSCRSENHTPTQKRFAEKKTTTKTARDNHKQENFTPTRKNTVEKKTTTKAARDNNTTDTWGLKIAAAGGGLILILILVVAACLKVKRTDKGLHERKHTNIPDQSVGMKMIDNTDMSPANEDCVYSFIPSAPPFDRRTGPEKSSTKSLQTDDGDVYHVYSTIPDLSPPSTKDAGLYMFLQNQ